MSSIRELKLAAKKVIKYYYLYFKFIRYININIDVDTLCTERAILLISHDMSRTGAPFLLLHIVKELHRLGWKISVVSMNPGPLLKDFNAYSSVYISRNAKEFCNKLTVMKKYGLNRAIVNTVVAGCWCSDLKLMGFKVVSLVHELPRVIVAWNAIDNARNMSKASDIIFFPSKFVSEKFRALIGIDTEYDILPQGLFLKSNKHIKREQAAKYIREKYSINDKSIVLNVASGNLRKGFDLFVDMAVQEPLLNFIWVGAIDKDIYKEISEKINLNSLNNLHLIGYVTDVNELLNIYAGADVFTLTSREEPFGSIVLESMNAGTPVVGFRDAGGFQDIVKCYKTGFLVNFENIDEMLERVNQIVSDKILVKKMQINMKETIESFTFEKYVSNLLTSFGKINESL
jgi:glycosyltransferase involved in cell wall biosynthesis